MVGEGRRKGKRKRKLAEQDEQEDEEDEQGQLDEEEEIIEETVGSGSRVRKEKDPFTPVFESPC